jgi:1,4-dihydroxy-2-naphthoate octaprenyltransferase
MDALQARFRDKASEMLQNTPTIIVAMGHGRTFAIETCYVVGDSDEFHCIVKPNPVIVEALRDDAQVAFMVNQGFPTQMLQGVGRAFFLGGLDRHPQIREQTLAKIPDATGFLTTIRNLGVIKILPDHIALTDDTNLGLGPRPVYVPEPAKSLPDQRRRWLQALGVESWPLVLIPVLAAALLASQAALDVSIWLVVAVGLVAILIHVGTMLLATYTGFRRHIERSAALGSNRLLHDGLLSTRQVLEVGILCMAFGSALGLFLVGLRGTPLLAMGCTGVVAGLLHAGWPLYVSRRVVEDVAVFVGLGPVLTLGAFNALTGSVHMAPVLVSLPLGFLAESILHAGHLQSFAADMNARVRTLAVVLGWKTSWRLFYALVGLPCVLVVLLILTKTVSVWAWLTFLSVPLAARSLVGAWRTPADHAQVPAGLDRQIAQGYLVFGILLLCSLILD